MSERGTTVQIDHESIAESDAIAVALAHPITGKQPTRSAVVRLAIHRLFLSVCPTDKPIDVSESQADEVTE